MDVPWQTWMIKYFLVAPITSNYLAVSPTLLFLTISNISRYLLFAPKHSFSYARLVGCHCSTKVTGAAVLPSWDGRFQFGLGNGFGHCRFIQKRSTTHSPPIGLWSQPHPSSNSNSVHCPWWWCNAIIALTVRNQDTFGRVLKTAGMSIDSGRLELLIEFFNLRSYYQSILLT